MVVKDMAFSKARHRQEVAESVLPRDEWDKYNEQSSDVAGFMQLFYHAGCVSVPAYIVYHSLQAGCLPGLVAGEIMLGFVASFYFMGFHELIHNTAFRTKLINQVLAAIVGIFIFRGSNWFWSFHWLHHRYTQDADKDPELSGASSDLMDPSKSVLKYCRFLTGWPFGYERAWKMVQMALGTLVDPWVTESGMEQTVQMESAVYVVIYVAFVIGSILCENVRTFVIFYWLVPHMLGAGHLRWYQFAEHRACESGTYTDLDAWGSARTTTTWWCYCQLAWNMPYHIEHHAWPAVPFHLLPYVHERIKETQPKNRCLISGQNGYVSIHREFLRRVISGEATSLPRMEPKQKPEVVENGSGGCVNKLADKAAMAKLPHFTIEEVQKHNTKADCWVAVRGLVVDVTTFLDDHPGGPTILVSQSGKDATKMFQMIHPEGTLEKQLPDKCIIGVLVDDGGNLSVPLLNGHDAGAWPS